MKSDAFLEPFRKSVMSVHIGSDLTNLFWMVVALRGPTDSM